MCYIDFEEVDSWLDRKNKCFLEKKQKKINSSLGGFEPPTFRLTAERASRLRHRDAWFKIMCMSEL
jgi:hypothetical protein